MSVTKTRMQTLTKKQLRDGIDAMRDVRSNWRYALEVRKFPYVDIGSAKNARQRIRELAYMNSCALCHHFMDVNINTTMQDSCPTCSWKVIMGHTCCAKVHQCYYDIPAKKRIKQLTNWIKLYQSELAARK